MAEFASFLQNSIVELYLQSGKARRDNSIDIPFQGSLSLETILSVLEALRPSASPAGEEHTRPLHWINPTLQLDSIQRIIKYYTQKGRKHVDQGISDNNILFIDSSSYQIVRDEEPPFWRVIPRLIVVTFYAIFIMEPIGEEDAQQPGKNNTSYRPSPGTLCLKRMIPFCSSCSNVVGISPKSDAKIPAGVSVSKSASGSAVASSEEVDGLSPELNTNENKEEAGEGEGTKESQLAVPAAASEDESSLSYSEISKQVHGYVEKVHLSRQADGCLIVMVRSLSVSLDQSPAGLAQLQQTLQRQVKAEWKRDGANDKNCAVSGEPFSLLKRRHHCRASGLCVSNAFSLFTQTLPDLHHVWGEEPQRVCDPFIGLASSDPLEDIVLLSDRKTELAAVIAFCLAMHNRDVDPVPESSESEVASTAASASSVSALGSEGGGAEGVVLSSGIGRFVSIGDNVLLRFSSIESLSLLPAFRIVFMARAPTGETVSSSIDGEGSIPPADMITSSDGAQGRMPRRGKGRRSRRGRTARVSVPLDALDASLVDGVLTIYAPAPDPSRGSVCSSRGNSFDVRSGGVPGESPLWAVFPAGPGQSFDRGHAALSSKSQG